MSRRDQIRMGDAEVAEFLQGVHTLTLASHGPQGRIHLVAMWYGFVGDDLAMWTFPKSQKVQNLRRDPRVTALVEDGAGYSELVGVELSGRIELVDDFDWKRAAGASISERHTGLSGLGEFLDQQAAKRIGLKLVVEHVASWDHRKLAGAY